MLPCTFFESIFNAEGRIRRISCRFNIESGGLSAFFGRYIPVPCKSGDSFVFVYPLYSTFRSMICPRGIRAVIQKIYTSYSRLFACFFENIFKFSFVILDEVVGIGPEIIIVFTAVFLLSGNNMVSILIAEVVIKSFSRIGSVWI